LRDDKVAACRAVAPEMLVTANIGCALHLAQGLKQDGIKLPVLHTVTLLARQMGFTGDI
jgi:glycolate oxidase iron-sulfur subunit